MDRPLMESIDPAALSGKRVLVVSAPHNDALILCRCLSKAGAEIALLDTQSLGPGETSNSPMAEEAGIRWFGRHAMHGHADLDQLQSAVLDALGGLDALVVYPNLYDNEPLRTLDGEAWHARVTKPLDDIYALCRRFSEPIASGGNGRIVFVTSVQAKTGGWLTGGDAAYCTLAAALGGLSRVLAVELSSDAVTVNTVAPLLHAEDAAALIEKLPVKQLPDAMDTAGAILFLLSDGASFITGYSMDINSGLYMD